MSWCYRMRTVYFVNLDMFKDEKVNKSYTSTFQNWSYYDEKFMKND